MRLLPLVLLVSLALLLPGSAEPTIPAYAGVAELTTGNSIGSGVAFASGFVFVVGASVSIRVNPPFYEYTPYDGRVTKYLVTQYAFSEVWNKTYDWGGDEDFRAVRVASDGSLFVAGTEVNGGKKLLAVKLDGDGNVVWRNAVQGTGSTAGFALTLDGAGNPWIVGNTDSAKQYFAAKFSESTGALLGTCAFRYPAPSTNAQMGTGIRFLSGGDFVLSGANLTGGEGAARKFTLTRMTTACQEIWHVETSEVPGEYAVGPDTNPATDIITAVGTRGIPNAPGEHHLALTQSRNADSSLRWRREFDTSDPTSTDYEGLAVDVDGNGRAYVSGYRTKDPILNLYMQGGPLNVSVGEQSKFVTLKYLSDGTISWSVLYGETDFHDYANANTLNAAETELFVAGYKLRPSGPLSPAYVHTLTIRYQSI